MGAADRSRRSGWEGWRGSRQRMDGADAGFLYMETPTQHMHTLKIALLEPTPGLTTARFRAGVLDRLDRLPPLRRRAVPVPFALNHPVWVTQPSIDPDRHFFHHRVAAPGTMRQLESLIGEIASTGLDRSVPLWELHLCEGLEGGRIAIVGKMHHALADGVAANALLANVADVRTQEPLPAGGPTPGPPSADRPGAMVTAALLDATRQLALVPGLLVRTVRGLVAVVGYRRRAHPEVPTPVLDAPRVSFNGALSARRSYATCSMPLADVKAVRAAHPGVTLNDVVLAVVAGALRAWMDAAGEHPGRSLVAGVPTATDLPEAAPRLHGNRVSNLFTTLATDVDDPHERLRRIATVTAQSKQLNRSLGLSMLHDWVQFTPPAPFSALMQLYSRTRAASWHAAPFNVIVSNVPGPRQPATIGEARLADLFSVGPILEGIGLNVTVWSYVDRMNFSLLSCPDLLPDLGPLVDRFAPALSQLLLVESR